MERALIEGRDDEFGRHLLLGGCFDQHGHLTPQRHEQMRKRLNGTGFWNKMQQSQLLAQELCHDDSTELWSILMWNARPSPALARKLQRWFAAGLPLSRHETDAEPLARAS